MNASWDGGVSCTILWVTVTLTSDLVFRKIVSRSISYIIKGKNLKFGVWMQLWMAECHVQFLGHPLTLFVE